MSRQDYIEIAAIIAKAEFASDLAKSIFVNQLARSLRSGNIRFNTAKFVAACFPQEK